MLRERTVARTLALREPKVARGRLFASLLLAIVVLGVALGGAYDVLHRATALSRDELRSQSLLSEVLYARADISDVQSAATRVHSDWRFRSVRGLPDGAGAARQPFDPCAVACRRPARRSRRRSKLSSKLVRERLDAVQVDHRARAAATPSRCAIAVQQGNDEILTARLRIALKDFQDTQDRRLGDAERSLAHLTAMARLAWAAIAIVVVLGSLWRLPTSIVRPTAGGARRWSCGGRSASRIGCCSRSRR